jgi:predicted Zn-dependent peptidase
MPSIQQTNPASKANRLRELKSLLDDKIITEEEFEKEKKKILDEK